MKEIVQFALLGSDTVRQVPGFLMQRLLSQPEWVKSAKSKVVLKGTGDWLVSMLPEDPETTILKRLKRPKPEDQDNPDSAPAQRSEAPAR